MRIALLLTFLALAGSLFAQDDIRLFKPALASRDSVASSAMPPKQDPADMRQAAVFAPGTVKVSESDRIQALMAGYAAHKRPLDGYRIQIFIGDRAQAETARRSFLVKHPELPAYLSYLAPNFRVRVGDLRDRVEAEYLREELRGEFPGLYVVPDQIEPPRLP